MYSKPVKPVALYAIRSVNTTLRRSARSISSYRMSAMAAAKGVDAI
jgi:hypothetical protein